MKPVRFDRSRRLHVPWIALAGLFVLAFLVVTPPFQAPDEVGHFWRAYSIARGAILPVRREGKPAADVPRGVRDLVATLWVNTAGKQGAEAKIGIERIRRAMAVSLSHNEYVSVNFPAYYTTVPYLPQVIACFIGDTLRLRPLITFYWGRLLNAACALLLVGAAIRIASQRWPFVAIASLPMFLYLCGTWSPDAMTDALAFLVAALALSDDGEHARWVRFLTCSFLLALCKPAYFLISLLIIPRIRERRAIHMGALAAVLVVGVAISGATAQRNYFAIRTDVPVSPAAQALNVRLAPLAFARIVTNDYLTHWKAYLDHFVGHLGWLDIQLPRQLVASALCFLALLGVTTQRIDVRTRLVALFVVGGTLFLVSLSQYLVWTPIGGQDIEGIQGRYFLPVGPVILVFFSATDRFQRLTTVVRYAFMATVVTLNSIALVFIVRRYW